MKLNYSLTDLLDFGFAVFMVILSFLLIINIEPFPGQVISAFIISLVSIMLTLPLSMIFGFNYKAIKNDIKEDKKRIIPLFLVSLLALIFLIFTLIFYFKIINSIWLFIFSTLQIIIFFKKDLFQDKGGKFTRLILFLFIGIFFGAGLYKIFKILLMLGVNLPKGNPIIGLWGIIFYSVTILLIFDKNNKVQDFIFKHRIYLWILAGINLLIIMLGPK